MKQVINFGVGNLCDEKTHLEGLLVQARSKKEISSGKEKKKAEIEIQTLVTRINDIKKQPNKPWF